MNKDLLERVQTRQVQTEEMVRKLEGLRPNARRTVPDWTDCINVSLGAGADLADHWGAVLNALAGKLVYDGKPAMEMAIASTEHGYKTVWVRTS